jgi:hypothetical protein
LEDDGLGEHPPVRSILQKIDNNERRKDQVSVESKENGRSFMIRSISHSI